MAEENPYTRGEKVVPIYIENEMKDSYISYAMSVIVGRALPDVRDGLKPVHRRILYAMRELGLDPGKPYKKCARVVGEVLGKYHPHGDMAVFDALVRMVQDFSLRCPLIDGQGNFGCFTGDTKVKLLDGRDLSFEELAKEFENRQPFYVYSVDRKGRVTVGKARNPRIARRHARLIELTLDSGEKIRCTPDHRFLLRDGTYKEAQDLTTGDSMMAGYFKLAPVKEELNSEYLMVRQPRTSSYEFVHQETVTPEVYDQARTKNWVPQAERVLQHFPSFQAMLNEASTYNHRVVAKRWLDERTDVWDITVEEHHNFLLSAGVFAHNSIDGDTPAAMRYVEARLAPIAEELLRDIEKETVAFVPNFDESLTEPAVLPSVLPNLLINGSSGIAVGMATNIPPHNLNEVVDGVIKAIDESHVEIEALMRIIKGPDFPTGGLILGREGIREAYRTGRGLLKVQARCHIEQQKGGKEAIIITEIPYQVNKTTLLESIAQLVQEKRIEGITDLRDESDKEGMRVVIELKRDANSQVVLNQLYKHTQLETTFGVIMLTLVNGRPEVLNLKQLIEQYITFRKEIVIKRTQFDLRKAQERAHIVEGLKIAIAHLDEVIATIRKAASPPEAKADLVKRFKLTEIQAQAILEMQLQRLTRLEREKLEQEYLELIKRIELYQAILKSERKVLEIIKDEAQELAKRYGDERRTEIVAEAKEVTIEDLIAEEDVVIMMSHQGYIKRLPVSAYRRQRRGGVGVAAAEIREEDFIEHLFIASTHEFILFFTNKGRIHWLKVHEVPQASRQAKGKAIVNVLQLQPQERITAFVPVKEFMSGRHLVMATRQGIIKKTELIAYANPRKGGIIGITLASGDELIEVKETDGHKEIFLATRRGKSIRFPEEQVRQMGRAAKGVRGIRLAKGDYVVGMEIVRPDGTALTVTTQGFGKRTPIKEYRSQSRGGKGIINIKTTKRNGEVVGTKTVTDHDELMIITQQGMVVRCPVKDIRPVGRAAQGVRVISVKPKDQVASVARVIPEQEEEEKTIEAAARPA